MANSGASPRIPRSSNSSKFVRVPAQRSEDITAANATEPLRCTARGMCVTTRHVLVSHPMFVSCHDDSARCPAGLLPWVLTETLIGEDHIHEVTPRFGSSAGARSSLCDMSLIVAAAEPFRSRAANFTQNLVLLKHGTSLSREVV